MSKSDAAEVLVEQGLHGVRSTICRALYSVVDSGSITPGRTVNWGNKYPGLSRFSLYGVLETDEGGARRYRVAHGNGVLPATRESQESFKDSTRRFTSP